MKNLLIGGALLAALFASNPVVAQSFARGSSGHWETGPGPRGQTRWVRHAENAQASRSRSPDARGEDQSQQVRADCMAKPCCQRDASTAADGKSANKA